MQVWNIKLLLRKYANCNDDYMRVMAVDMQRKFAKYWDGYSVILVMAARGGSKIRFNWGYITFFTIFYNSIVGTVID